MISPLMSSKVSLVHLTDNSILQKSILRTLSYPNNYSDNFKDDRLSVCNILFLRLKVLFMVGSGSSWVILILVHKRWLCFSRDRGTISLSLKRRCF